MKYPPSLLVQLVILSSLLHQSFSSNLCQPFSQQVLVLFIPLIYYPHWLANWYQFSLEVARLAFQQAHYSTYSTNLDLFSILVVRQPALRFFSTD